MSQLQGFSPRLTRAGIVIATALVLTFSIVPAAHSTQSAPTPSDQVVSSTPTDSPTQTPAPADAPPQAPAPADAPTPTDSPTPAQPTNPGQEPTPAEPSIPGGEPTPVDVPDDVEHTVPTPVGDDAVITVKIGGDRTRANTVGNLEGVKLRLHDGDSNNPSAPRNNSWAVCTSDSNGDCSFTVPDTGRTCVAGIIIFCSRWEDQANRDKQFWVVQESAPSGWTANQSFVVGTSGTNTTQKYAFRTGSQLRAGSTYRSGSHFMTAGFRDNTSNSTGTWQNSRRNPSLASACPVELRVGLVLDLSGSVSNAGALGTLKDSAKGMVDALRGTNAEMALYTFSSDAPRSSGNDGRNWPSLPIDQGTNADTIKSRIDAYGAGGGTNWDSGLWQVASSTEKHDLVIVVTDGMPTYSYGNTSTAGTTTSFDEIEAAIFSANAIKAKGSRVLAVGVGNGVKDGAANLAAISGTTPYRSGGSITTADYVQAEWNELAELLTGAAMGATCRADIEILKQTLATGATSPAPGGAGWKFRATASAPGTLRPTGEQTTGADSLVDYQVKFTTPRPERSSEVNIEELLSTEQKSDGWTLDSIDCSVNGKKVTVNKDSISLDVTAGDTAKCTVTNRQQLVPGISITKKAWDTPSADGLDGAKEITSGATVTDGRTITWTYLVKNTGKTPLDGIGVVDDRLPASAVKCPKTRLNPGETMTCSASGAVTK